MNNTQLKSIESIYKSSLKFLMPLTLVETYHTVVNEAIRLVGGFDGVVLLGKKGGFDNVYTSSSIVTNSKIRPRGFTYKSFKNKKTLVMDYKTLLKTHPELAQIGIKSAVFIPLTYKDESIGVLIIRSRKQNSFSEDKLGILKLFGSFASVAIRKSQLHQEARDALEVRDLFIAMASHELKTPITTIAGYTDLIKNKLDRGLKINPKWIHSMYRENRRLIYLINELLEINQIRQGELVYDFKEFNIVKVVETAISNFKIQYPHRKILFQDNMVNVNGSMIGDSSKILQVLENILINAEKFSEKASVIKVGLEVKNKYIYLIVRDNGVGIKKQNMKKVFEKYYKGNPNKKEGMGLGLYLVKEIVKKHKGIIKVKSKKNSGTEVSLLFPKTYYE